METNVRAFLACVLASALACGLVEEIHGQHSEKVRSHPRLPKERPEGQRHKLSIGTLFLPKNLERAGKVPLFVHFHGSDWLPEVAAARHGHTAVISVQLGQGSSVYARPFQDARAFGRLLLEAEKKAGVEWGTLTLTGWSAGYGAIRAILKDPEYYRRVDGVLLLDGMHAGYVADRAARGPDRIVPEHMAIYLQWAKDAVLGKKRFVVTHTQIVPPDYASTTETADYLLHHLKLERQQVRKVGPMLTEQLSEARQGRFLLIGYAGDTREDHLDILYGLPVFLTWVHAAGKTSLPQH